MAKSAAQVVRPLTLKFVVAFALLAILAAANFLILRASIRENAGLAAIVNQAGRQRMLLQRTATYSERFVFSFNDAERSEFRSRLRNDTYELERSHHELMAPVGAERIGEADDVLAIYEDSPWLLDSEMRNYLLHLRSLTNAQPEELTFENPHLSYIRNSDTLDKIRDGLEAVVDVYQSRSEAKTAHLNLLALWSFASTLVLLLLNGWFVFRPMAHQVRNDIVQLNELNETLEQRVTERTLEAERRALLLTQSEAALRESEELYSSLARHLPMSVLRKDRQGRLLFANEVFCRLIERPLDELLGKFDGELYSPERAETSRAQDDHVMATGNVLHSVEEHETASGRSMLVELIKVPLRDTQGDIVGTQTMFWDVTERHDAEQRALQAERLAAIGQVVTGVAHESRNALQQIRACSQMLKWELEGDGKLQELVIDLQQAEERLLRMFEELRSFAAPVKLEQRLCDVRGVAANAWSSITGERSGRDVELVEATNGAATHCIVDPFQLEQVFRNLFENAIAACDDPVRIEMVYEFFTNGNQSELRIEVRDNGPGLTGEQKMRIFEPFFTTKTKGTGLGMAIVKRIVEAHGGRIQAESSNAGGAVVAVTLPADPPPLTPSMNQDLTKANLK